MKRLISIMLVMILGGLVLSGCPKRDQPPETAYDPEIVEAARAIAEEANNPDTPPPDKPQPEPERGECSWKTGGCQVGWICWDSWFCKSGFEDECSASGDKRCHKQCTGDMDCPNSMPRCKEKPIFQGSERGNLHKFCVGEND